VRDAVFEKLFASLERDSRTPEPRSLFAGVPERLPSTRKWDPGDDPRDIDWNSTLRNRIRRDAGTTGLAESDLET